MKQYLFFQNDGVSEYLAILDTHLDFSEFIDLFTALKDEQWENLEEFDDDIKYQKILNILEENGKLLNYDWIDSLWSFNNALDF